MKLKISFWFYKKNAFFKGETILRYIKMDSRSRMIPSELEKQIEQDQKEGLIPWVLVGSAGVITFS